MTNLFTKRDAYFSPDRRYRYWLRIVWDESKPLCAVIGLNPSTADEIIDDPTLRRVQGFARQWGCGGVLMLNVFAYRATDPHEMLTVDDPIGQENYGPDLLSQLQRVNGPWVAAWGVHAGSRGDDIAKYISRYTPGRLRCFGKNRNGSPKHPLYLRADTKLRPYFEAA